MLRLVRDIRLIPVALIASACLLVLTVADLVFDGGRWLGAGPAPPDHDAALVHVSPDAPPAPGTKRSWAQQMFDFPGGSGQAPPSSIVPPLDPAAMARAKMARAKAEADNPDITGSIPTKPAPHKNASAPQAGAAAAPAGDKKVKNGKTGETGAAAHGGVVIRTEGTSLPSSAKIAILERLEQRREQLDARARALDIRESLVKAAEKRIAAQLAELKAVEARIAAKTQENNKADAARFAALVKMYETMKPRDAAKIFNGLDMPVLLKVVSRIKPRIMADIMAQMSPQIAERLTVEMASRAEASGKTDPAQLPKIVGHPTAP